MFAHRLLLPVVLLNLSALPAVAQSVEEITVQIYDRATGRLIPLGSPPNPYGLDMDLLIAVKLKGPTPARIYDLNLSMDAPAYNTPATGLVPALKVRQSRRVSSMPESRTAFFPFALEYVCYPEVMITARLDKSFKTRKIGLGCAE